MCSVSNIRMSSMGRMWFYTKTNSIIKKANRRPTYCGYYVRSQKSMGNYIKTLVDRNKER